MLMHFPAKYFNSEVDTDVALTHEVCFNLEGVVHLVPSLESFWRYVLFQLYKSNTYITIHAELSFTG